MSSPELDPVDPLSMPASNMPESPGVQPAAPLAPQQRTQKPRSNVYTMMLILSFFALVTGCVVLYMELSTYGTYPWWKVPAELSAGG